MAATFTTAFRGTTLRKHRRKILFEREKALLPAIQVFVGYKREIKRFQDEYAGRADRIGWPTASWASRTIHLTDENANKLHTRWRKLDMEYCKLLGDIGTAFRTIIRVKEEWAIEENPALKGPKYEVLREARRVREEMKERRDAMKELWTTLGAEYREETGILRELSLRINMLQRQYDGTDGNAPVQRREFIMKCPAEDCRGFLSTAYKCGTCEKYTCSECLVIKDGKDHTCNPDTVESAKTIRAETQPCPKCGTRIFKIDGCFAANTPLLMWDGSYKMSQDISVGDLLIGDDGSPRTVEELCSGDDELYEICQSNGINYTVNSKHTLVLRQINTGHSIEIKVCDYIKLPGATKAGHLGFKRGEQGGSSITVKHVGKGRYYGWSVSGNRRFLLKDTTVLRNCDQMWCVMEGCNTAFSWHTGHIVTGVIHNPHYYEMLRKNGGIMPREHGDIPCGGMPTTWQFVGAIHNSGIDQALQTNLLESFRNLQELIDMRLRDYPARPAQLANKDADVEYLMNTITEEAWQKKLVDSESRFARKKEIGQILQTLSMAVSDAMNRIFDKVREEEDDALLNSWILDVAIPDLQRLREFGNQALKDLGKRDQMAVPQFLENWAWDRSRILYRTVVKKAKTPVTEADAPLAEP